MQSLSLLAVDVLAGITVLKRCENFVVYVEVSQVSSPVLGWDPFGNSMTRGCPPLLIVITLEL